MSETMSKLWDEIMGYDKAHRMAEKKFNVKHTPLKSSQWEINHLAGRNFSKNTYKALERRGYIKISKNFDFVIVED